MRLLMSRPQDLGSLDSHVRNLRYAVATTTCRATVAVLKQMLSEAEARLQERERVAERVELQTALEKHSVTA